MGLRWLRAVAAVVVLATGTAIPAPAAAGPPTDLTPATPYAKNQPIGEVTLLTGDVVAVGVDSSGALTAEVTGRAARADGHAVLYDTVRDHDALYVYPSDALGDVTAGRLDRRLFDVAYLVRNGFDDKATGTLPVIVQHPKTLSFGKKTATLDAVDAAALSVEKSDAGRFWAQARTGKVWLDAKVTADLDRSVPQIGAPEAWAAGYDGTGVKVAILDTGVDQQHPDLAGKVVAAESFIPGQSVQDGHGHGTHVASTVAGSGAASGGRYRGVAPGASLLIGKVLDNTGSGSESQIIAGMQWAVRQGADVVSMSLGACCTDGTDPMSQAVNTLSAQSGTLFVIAAGNEGALGNRTVGTPGAADAALTVAAVDKQDQFAPFSSKGPRYGDFGLKPDIAAPGVDITAARLGGGYTTLSGTSMATPHVAGAAAILAQRHPDWTGQRLKDTLMGSAKDVGRGAFEVGAGRVDVARAVRTGITATGSVDFGRIAYDGAAVTRTVRYANDTDAPVTLGLTTSVRPRNGTAPASVLRLDRTSVTVPAHGTAPVVATFDPSAGPDSWYQGAIRAHADGVEVVTSVGGFRDLKKVSLTLKVVTPDGGSRFFYGGWLLTRIDGRDEVPAIGEGPDGPETTGTVYAGRYAVRTFVEWRDRTGAPNAALVTAPDVDASRDATVVLDLRRAKRVNATPPRPSELYEQQFGFSSTAAGGALSVRSELSVYGPMTMWTLPTGKPSLGDFYAYSQQVHVAPRLAMRGPGWLSTLDARYPPAGPAVGDNEIARFDGHRALEVVPAGHGTPSDLSGLDLRGKLVLMDLSDLCGFTCTGTALDRVRAAAAAGAAGVAGFATAGRGFLDPDPYAGPGNWPAYPIPTVSLPADQGRQLRAAAVHGTARVEVTGTLTPQYVAALTFPWLGRIPAALGGQVRAGDLYEIEQRVHADGPGVATLTWDAQLPLASATAPIRRTGSGNSLPVRAPATVTVLLGPVGTEVGWSHGASLSYDAPPSVRTGGWDDTVIEAFPRPGRRTDDLGEQPLVSNTSKYTGTTARYFTRTCLSCRNGDMFNPVHVLDNNGRGSGYQAYDITNGYYGDKQTELHLYRDGVELPQQQGIVWIAPPWFAYYNAYYTLPPERATYRLTERYESLYPMQRWARTVESAWTFTSQRPTTGYTSPSDGANCMGWYITFPKPRDVCQPTGQLFVGYDLGLRLDNTLPAGGVQRVTLSAYHSPFLTPAPRVTTLELWTSPDDGAHWTRVPTQRQADGRYGATLVNPRTPGGAMTLRVRAVDASGAVIDQTVHNAYGLE